MAEEQRKAKCANIWHRNPGGFIKCPVCGMTQSEQQALNDAAGALGAANVPGSTQNRILTDPTGVRILFKHFEGDDVRGVINELNEWCRMVSADDRQRIVNVDLFTLKDMFHAVVAINMVFNK